MNAVPTFEIDDNVTPPRHLVDGQPVSRAEFLTKFEQYAPDRRLTVEEALAAVDVETGTVTGDPALVAVALARALRRANEQLDAVHESLDRMTEGIDEWHRQDAARSETTTPADVLRHDG